MIRRVISVFLVVVAIANFEVILRGQDEWAKGILLSLMQLIIAYYVWPKKFNSLVQFGYSYDLLDDPIELDHLKSKFRDSPYFKIWVGDIVVIAYNNELLDDKFAIAQRKQFTRNQLQYLSPERSLKYHSYDKEGIWFEIITDEKVNRLKKKPYPFK